MEQILLKSEALYDTQAIQRIMTLAAELQHKKADSLTTEELEALGTELGLEAQAVRQAITLYEEEKERGLLQTGKHSALLPKLTGRRSLLVFLMCVSIGLIHGICIPQDEGAISLLLLATAAWPVAAWLTRNPLGGALVGGGTMLFAAILHRIHLQPFQPYPSHFAEQDPFTVVMLTIIGAFIGLASEWRYHRKEKANQLKAIEN